MEFVLLRRSAFLGRGKDARRPGMLACFPPFFPSLSGGGPFFACWSWSCKLAWPLVFFGPLNFAGSFFFCVCGRLMQPAPMQPMHLAVVLVCCCRRRPAAGGWASAARGSSCCRLRAFLVQGRTTARLRCTRLCQWPRATQVTQRRRQRRSRQRCRQKCSARRCADRRRRGLGRQRARGACAEIAG